MVIKKIPKSRKPIRSIPKKKQAARRVVSAPTAGPETIKRVVPKPPSIGGTSIGGRETMIVSPTIPSMPPPSKKPPSDSYGQTIEKPKGGMGKFPREDPWEGSKGGRVGKFSGGSVSARLSKAGPVAKPN